MYYANINWNIEAKKNSKSLNIALLLLANK